MNILFTPAGFSDPVRNFFDGPMLHIVRHKNIDKVIIFLTNETGKKEADERLFSQGIRTIVPDCPIDVYYSHITNPQNFEDLMPLIYLFDAVYR